MPNPGRLLTADGRLQLVTSDGSFVEAAALQRHSMENASLPGFLVLPVKKRAGANSQMRAAELVQLPAPLNGSVPGGL